MFVRSRACLAYVAAPKPNRENIETGSAIWRQPGEGGGVVIRIDRVLRIAGCITARLQPGVRPARLYVYASPRFGLTIRFCRSQGDFARAVAITAAVGARPPPWPRAGPERARRRAGKPYLPLRAGVRVLEQEAGRRADSHLKVAVWGFSHRAGCGDILTSSDVGISSRKLGGGHGP